MRKEQKRPNPAKGLGFFYVWYNECMSYYSENRELILAYQHAYYEANKEARLAYQNAYYEANKEARRAYQREYDRTHPKRVSKEKQAWKDSLKFKRSDIQARYETVDDKCEYCGKELHGLFHADHYIPKAKGGTNDPENLRISCHSCNYKKGNKMPAPA